MTKLLYWNEIILLWRKRISLHSIERSEKILSHKIAAWDPEEFQTVIETIIISVFATRRTIPRRILAEVQQHVVCEFKTEI